MERRTRQDLHHRFRLARNDSRRYHFVPAEHAFGNSDGDLQMLQWTAAGELARFAGLVHHTDAEREYAYDRESKVGKLDKVLGEAAAKGWTVVDMKKDCKAVFPAEK
jgi:hypothetical protein